jgi:predicted nucleotidyltransferase
VPPAWLGATCTRYDAAMQTDPVVQAVREVLGRTDGLSLGFVFGSFASGCAREHSDVDVAVRGAGPLAPAAKLALVGDLAQATGRPVDLVDLCTAGGALLGQILQHGVRVLGSEADHAELLSRHWIDEADFGPSIQMMLRERRHAWTTP